MSGRANAIGVTAAVDPVVFVDPVISVDLITLPPTRTQRPPPTTLSDPREGRRDPSNYPRPTMTFEHWRIEDEAAMAVVVGAASAMRGVRSGREVPPGFDRDAATSPEALELLLDAPGQVSDVAVIPGLSDATVFNSRSLAPDVDLAEVERSRREVDGLVGHLLRERGHDGDVRVSGHLLYPPGGFMGWHTNERVPGLRAYLTLADEPGRSWFRYWDPVSEEIVTSMDSRCDLRLFEVGGAAPFWHCVRSEVHRFSFGYRVGVV